MTTCTSSSTSNWSESYAKLFFTKNPRIRCCFCRTFLRSQLALQLFKNYFRKRRRYLQVLPSQAWMKMFAPCLTCRGKSKLTCCRVTRQRNRKRQTELADKSRQLANDPSGLDGRNITTRPDDSEDEIIQMIREVSVGLQDDPDIGSDSSEWSHFYCRR